MSLAVTAWRNGIEIALNSMKTVFNYGQIAWSIWNSTRVARQKFHNFQRSLVVTLKNHNFNLAANKLSYNTVSHFELIWFISVNLASKNDFSLVFHLNIAYVQFLPKSSSLVKNALVCYSPWRSCKLFRPRCGPSFVCCEIFKGISNVHWQLILLWPRESW
jgi:hypothetical protein